MQLEKELYDSREQLSSTRSKYESLLALNNQGEHFINPALFRTDHNYFSSSNQMSGDQMLDSTMSSSSSRFSEKIEGTLSRLSSINASRIVKTIKGGKKAKLATLPNPLNLDIKKVHEENN
jgi:hypothetical protein